MSRTIPWLIAAAVILSPVGAYAQVLGPLTWQLQPYCNRVILTLTGSPTGFALSGSDDQCGSVTRGSASGVAVFNADGTVGLNFTIVTPPAGLVVHVSATVSPATGQGTWSDDVGNSGTFAFGGDTAGLPARPLLAAPIDIADNPNEAADPCNVPTARPTLLLCGNTAGRWTNGGFGLPGLQVWREGNGQAHIRGSANRSSGGVGSGGILFVLPASLIPKRTLALTISTGQSAGVHQGGTALLLVYGPDVPGAEGVVRVYSASHPAHTVAHLGEVVFSVDR